MKKQGYVVFYKVNRAVFSHVLGDDSEPVENGRPINSL